MKCCKKTITIYLLALALAGLLLAGCGKSKDGGGGAVSTKSWYQDNDGDGFGNPDKVQNIETQPDGYVDNPNDCNDENKVINPSAIEVYDNIDNNCNEETDEQPKAGIIPDTGQTSSYTDTLGEDSDYLIDAPSYTKLDANGQILPDSAISWKMVKDNVTGLIWEIKDTVDGVENTLNIHDGDNKYTWEDASTVFIKNLNDENFGGFDDDLTWRIPTIREICLLANSTLYGPSISKTYFLLPSGSQIWSSSSYPDPETKAWYYSTYFGQTAAIDKTSRCIVFAVRGKEVPSEFDDYDSNIIKDNATGLMWQKASTKGVDEKGMTFEAAIAYCENLELGGYKDWRLPNRNELTTLFSFDLKEPSIDKNYFSDTLSSSYWSSTTLINNNDSSDRNSAWLAKYFEGIMLFGEKDDLAWVRAVRGGNNALNRTWFRDGDSDGYGDSTVTKTIDASSPQPAGYVDNYTDCNDAVSTISPAATEIADDGVDQNCTGSDTFVWYKDSDDDGYGDKEISVSAETKPETYVHNTAHIAVGLFDCNDSNKSIHPGMEELVDDGLDNDCNGLQSVSWYLDSDGDGYGDGPRVSSSETAPADGTYAKNDLDCNNADSTIHPGLVELFDGDIDSNCNGDSDDEMLRIIPDTGQTATYTGTPNDDEDGDYLINSPLHTKIASNGGLLDSGAEDWVAVRDNFTGLYWEVKTLANKNDAYTFENAADYADSLDLAGFTDWRLPTLEELATISNLGMSNPAIDPVYFSNMVADKYWTATDLGSDTKALAIWFRDGQSIEGNKTDYFRVISVRGGQSLTARLILNPDGTAVTDTESGLMWSDILTTDDTWGNMMDHWSGENIAGYSDWRLPTANDMDTLLDILQDDSVFDYFGVFENMTFTGSFWTSALAATDPAKAVIFSFITGETDEAVLAQTLRGIGVRSVKQTRFIVNGDGTVFDSKTGLMWMQENSNSGRAMTFKGVLSYFTTLIFAGYDDWRLPNRNEMISLLGASIDDNASFSAAFKDSNANYWTSSSCPGVIDPDFDYAWQVNFKTETGSVAITIGEYSNTNVFRAVRGGNPE